MSRLSFSNVQSNQAIGSFVKMIVASCLGLLALSGCGSVSGWVAESSVERGSIEVLELSFETLANGTGTRVTSVDLSNSGTVDLFSVVRTSTGTFKKSVVAVWSQTPNLGTLTANADRTGSRFVATTVGTGKVKIEFEDLSAEINVNVASPPLSLALSTTATSPTNISTIPFSLTFNGSVTGLSIADFELTNATVASISGSGSAYSINVTPTGDGPLTVQLKAASVVNDKDEPNLASDVISLVSDRTPPTVTGLANDPTLRNTKTWSWACDETCTYRFVVDMLSTWVTPIGTFGSTATATQSSGNGVHYIHVQAVDAAGNESSVVDASVTLDNTLPAAPTGWTISSPSNASTSSDGTPVIAGTGMGAEDGGTALVYADAACTTQIASATIASGAVTINTISYLTNGSQDGAKAYYGRVQDVATNQSACTNLSLGYTLDTQTPSAPSGWTLSSPSTASTSSDATPQIAATGLVNVDGGTARVFSDAGCTTQLGSTATVSSGAFSITDIAFLTNGTEDGAKAFYGLLTDTAGNATACTNLSLGYTLDTQAPSSPSGWTQSSPGNGATSNDGTPVIAGTGLSSENGSTVYVYDNVACTTAVGQATVTSGAFSVSNITYVTNGSVDGTKAFYGKMVDAASNASACVSLSLGYTLDSAAPAGPSGWTLSSPANGATSTDATPVISATGLASLNGYTAVVYSNSNCSTQIGSTATISGGAFTINDITYLSNGTQDGAKAYYGKVISGTGVESSCGDLSLGYTLDTQTPAVPAGWTLTSPSTSPSSDYTPRVSGSGLSSENGSTALVYAGAGCSTLLGSATIASGAFQVDFTYASDGSADGAKTYYGIIRDAALNESACTNLSLGYTLDTQNPTVTAGNWSLSPTSGAVSNDVTPEFSGTSLSADNGGTVSIYGESGCSTLLSSASISAGAATVTGITYASNGSADGAKAYYARIQDASGNTSSCTSLSLGYTLDTTAPSNPSGWTMSSPSNGATSSDTTPQVAGSGLSAENGSTAKVYAETGCSTLLGSATISSGGFTVTSISYASNGSADGTKSYWGMLTDTAGNSSSCTALSLGYTLDTTAPSAPSGWTISSPSNGVTSTDYTPQIAATGLTGSDGGTARVYADASCATQVGSETVASGAFSITNISFATDGSADGTKAFYGRIEDASGNLTACTNLSIGYTLDRTAPTVNTGNWSMSSPASSSTSSDTTPQFAGSSVTGADGGTARLYADASCATQIATGSVASGSSSITSVSYASNGTADAAYSYYMRIEDAVGNSSSCTNLLLGYTLDTTVPANPSGWTMSSPSSGVTSNDNTPVISATGLSGHNGDTVNVYGTVGCTTSLGSTTVSAGAFTANLTAYATNGTDDGVKAYYGKFTDAAGNASSCVNLSLGYTLQSNQAPVATAFTDAGLSEDTSKTVTLTYTDSESDQASTCSTSNLSNVTVITPCACSTGTCTVVVQGTSNYFGAAGFDFTVTAAGQTSNTATATLTIASMNDVPVLGTNTGFSGDDGSTTTITTSMLSSTDVESATSAITYSVTQVPTQGALKKSGTTLTVGGTFTQADLAASSMTYVHTGLGLTDTFRFTVSDANSGYATNATVASPATFSITLADVVAPECTAAIAANAAVYTYEGAGTVGSPYLLCTKAQIGHLATHGCGPSGISACASYFKLGTSLDMTGFSHLPIGSNTFFTGNFNGNNKKISNLTYSGTGKVGLFGYTNTGVNIYDLKLVNVAMTGTESVGSLVGFMSGTGTLNNITVTGSVTGSDTLIGGLIGSTQGATITNVTSAVVVQSSGSTQAGGLMGGGTGTASVSNAIVTGNVSSTHSSPTYLGGFAGYWASSGNISNVTVSGTVTSATAGSQIGGFIGTWASNGSISKVVSTGAVSAGNGTQYVGGFIGYAGGASGGTISNCYARGNVTLGTSASQVGGFIGSGASNIQYSYYAGVFSVGASSSWTGALTGYVSGGTWTGNFFDSTIAGTANATGNSAGNVSGGTGETTANMQTSSTFTGAGWNFTTNWEIIGSNYPTLK